MIHIRINLKHSPRQLAVRVFFVRLRGLDRTGQEFVFDLYFDHFLVPGNSDRVRGGVQYKSRCRREFPDDPASIGDILKLKDRRGYLPGQLSGGQQQRVSIGRALMNAPAVVLADEPTGNLDSGNSREIVELLKYSIRIYDQTMIMITHDEDIALQADRLIELADGRIIRDEVIRG